MPFNFRRLPDGKYLISNMTGMFSVLESQDQVLQLLREPSLLPDAFKSDLRNKLFISDEASRLTVVRLLASGYAARQQVALKKPQLFMVVPTLRCDHNCTYCQVSRAPEHADGYDLNSRHVSAIVEFINRIAEKPCKIEIQGGEPLLRFDFIQRLYEGAEKSIKEDNFEFVIATSLSLLSEKIINWSISRKVNFSVSLDGVEATHNKHRRHGKVSSYKKVVEGIERLSGKIERQRISTVTTVTKEGLQDPIGLVDQHLELGLNGLYVRPLSPYGFAERKGEKQYSLQEFFTFYKALIEYVVEINKRTRFVEYNAFTHLQKIYQPLSSGHVDLQSPSGYVLGALVINYDGLVFGSDEARMIHEVYKLPELVLGKVSDLQLNLENAVNLLSKTFIAETLGCDFCVYSPYCGADPMYHFITQGDYVGNKAISRFCQERQQFFDFFMSKLKDDSQFELMAEGWLANDSSGSA